MVKKKIKRENAIIFKSSIIFQAHLLLLLWSLEPCLMEKYYGWIMAKNHLGRVGVSTGPRHHSYAPFTQGTSPADVEVS